MVEIEREIRDVIVAVGQLPVDALKIGAQDDLYQAGLTSFATVQLMLGLENKFDFEFPDRLLNRQTFSSVQAIAKAVAQLLAEKEAA